MGVANVSRGEISKKKSKGSARNQKHHDRNEEWLINRQKVGRSDTHIYIKNTWRLNNIL